ncbi:MAG TPA: nuclear transport factor 2 family protein [Solirubrobacteraceae bacterium]|nr:nuclear transport factor 2 family protein [Solirubrobacteraceae bacterium]
MMVDTARTQPTRQQLLEAKGSYTTVRGVRPEVVRVIAEGDFVAVHGRLEHPDAAVIDINRFDRDGKVVEHWDVVQAAAATPAGTAMMFDGGGDPDAVVSPAQLAANKAVVERLYAIERAGDADALGEVIADDFHPHDPQTPSGLTAAKRRLRDLGPVDVEVHRMLASGELVLAHWLARGMVGAEIFRLSDGTIVERWGVTQPAA